MSKYSLPFDLNLVDTEEVILIDMAAVNFNTEDKYKSAFIFLRNSGVQANLDFSGCTFEDKERCLVLFLTEDIEVNSIELANTWIEILCAKYGGGVKLPSILNSEEIQLFINRNKKLIEAAYQLINSLPIYSMCCSPLNGKVFNVDEFPKTDDHTIKITNFAKLSFYNDFSMLIDGSYPGKFYTMLFIKEEPRIVKMMDRLPYLGLLTAMFAPNEVQEDLRDKIQEYLTPSSVKEKEESSNDCEGTNP